MKIISFGHPSFADSAALFYIQCGVLLKIISYYMIWISLGIQNFFCFMTSTFCRHPRKHTCPKPNGCQGRDPKTLICPWNILKSDHMVHPSCSTSLLNRLAESVPEHLANANRAGPEYLYITFNQQHSLFNRSRHPLSTVTWESFSLNHFSLWKMWNSRIYISKSQRAVITPCEPMSSTRLSASDVRNSLCKKCMTYSAYIVILSLAGRCYTSTELTWS